MRDLMVAVLMIAICSGTGAYAGSKNNSKEMAQFANEIAAKLVYKPEANISVRAQDCHLHIEYGSLHVAFDLPLKGTTLAENETEDGIILSNAQMTRTLKDRNPEAYERIILKFDRKTNKTMMKTFENVITVCGGGKTVAAVY